MSVYECVCVCVAGWVVEVVSGWMVEWAKFYTLFSSASVVRCATLW